MSRISIGYLEQANQLKAIRGAGDLGIANFSACQDVLRRVDKTFAAFFRRVKAGDKPGYPRFRSRLRYDSLTWPSWGNGCALRPSGRLYLQGVGDLKIKWHRPLPADASIKTVTAKRQAGQWYACFSVEMPEPGPLPVCDSTVGIDVGLTTFAVLSDGVNPAGTTQTCCACGVVVPKSLAERWHHCPACGLSLSRDHNAARNMLQLARGLGWSLQAPTVETAHAVA
jgi:transposase